MHLPTCTTYVNRSHDGATSYCRTVVAEQGNPSRKFRLNTLFKYMYRDASNYKLHGEAIFTNHTLLPIADIEKQIRSFLNDGEYFIAGQVNIEERFFDVLHDDDHPWHEFENVEETSIKAFDPENWKQRQHLRDITEFIADLEKAHRSSWDENNVRPDVARLLEQRKAKLKKASEEGKDILE